MRWDKVASQVKQEDQQELVFGLLALKAYFKQFRARGPNILFGPLARDYLKSDASVMRTTAWPSD
jgi:hypothetical protein